MLVGRFGEQTSIQVRGQRLSAAAMRSAGHQQHQHVDDEDALCTSTQSGAGLRCTTHKASVTTRIGGFGVTLASVADNDSQDAAREKAAAFAVSSNVDEIDANAEPIFDRLRYLALGLGRMLRFSIVPAVDDPAAAADEEAVPTGFVCGAYEKDDWHLGNRHVLHSTATGSTPKAAFLAALYGVCTAYQALADASPKGLEDIAELEVFLRGRGKTIDGAPTISKQQDGTKTRFTAAITVLDAYGSTYTVSSGAVATAYAACRSCALQAYKYEEYPTPRPFLTRLRWQLDALADAALREEETRQLVALATDGGFRYAPLPDPSGEFLPCEPEVSVDTQQFGSAEHGHFATVYYGNRELAQAQAAGAYAAELAVVASAIERLMARAPDVAERYGLPFANVGAMADEYRQVCQFSAVDALKGAKVSPYAVLGACCSRHFHGYYGVTYAELDAGAHRATVHVDDFSRDGKLHRRVIGEAVAKARGQAWKTACISALRGNFPAQLAEVEDRDDFKANGGGGGSASSGAKNAAANRDPKEAAREALIKATAKLPRATRVEKCANLLQLVESFGTTDLGWRQVAMHAEQDPQGHWRAELRCRNERDGSWVVLAAGKPAGTKRDAVKLTTYTAAAQFFPADTEQFISLGKSDITRADFEQLNKSAPFTADNCLVLNQLHALGAGGVPAALVVETSPSNPRGIRVAVRAPPSAGGREIAAVTSDPAAAPEHPLKSDGTADTATGDVCSLFAVVSAAIAAAGRERKVEARVLQLTNSHRGYAPPVVQRIGDLLSYLFSTTLGAAPLAQANLNGQVWQVQLVIRLPFVPDCPEIVLARVASSSKKEGVRLAHLAALQRNFGPLLTFYRRTTLELQGLSDEVLRSPRFDVVTGAQLDILATVAVKPKPAHGTAAAGAAASASGGGADSTTPRPRLSSSAQKRHDAAAVAAAPPPPPEAAVAVPRPHLNAPAAPYRLLKAKLREDEPDVSVVPEWTLDMMDPKDVVHKCTLRKVPIAGSAAAKAGAKAQVISTGEGACKSAATHNAALMALDTLYTEDLERIVTMFPEWAEEPTS
jgi:hypothetical protein